MDSVGVGCQPGGNPEYDELIAMLAPGDVVTADTLHGRATKGALANAFGYGVRCGYLTKAPTRAPSMRRPWKGPILNVYVRTDVPIVTSPSELQCEHCGVMFSRNIKPGGQPESWTRFQVRKHCTRDCARAAVDAHSLGLRTVVARTCVVCGALKDGAKFATTRTSTHSTCIACRSAHYVSTLTDAELRAARRRVIRNRKGRLTYTGAARNGYIWTGPEIELLAREDLTTIQIAEMVQRTPYAVQEQRRLLRKGDPQTLLLLNGPGR